VAHTEVYRWVWAFSQYPWDSHGPFLEGFQYIASNIKNNIRHIYSGNYIFINILYIFIYRVL